MKGYSRTSLMDKVLNGTNLKIWEECRAFVNKYSGIDMSVGARKVLPPKFLLDNLCSVMSDAGNNQYTSGSGHPELREAISAYYGPIFYRDINKDLEVVVGSGARMCIAGSIFGLLEPEDEVITFEPTFPMVNLIADMAQAIPKGSPLNKVMDQEGNVSFKIDFEHFESMITPKTKLLFLNNPHNPTGKSFTIEEYVQLSLILDKHPRIVVLADEVYSHVIFHHGPIIHFANIIDNWKRTVTVFSGGKLFDATGWMIGWAIGPSNLILPMREFIISMTFCANVLAQAGMAKSIPQLEDKYEEFNTFGEFVGDNCRKNQEILIEFLNSRRDIGLKPIKAEGGFFILLDCTELGKSIPSKYYTNQLCEDLCIEPRCTFPDQEVPLDFAVYRYLAVECRVVFIPCSIFNHISSHSISHHFIRVSLCVPTQLMNQAITNLSKIL